MTLGTASADTAPDATIVMPSPAELAFRRAVFGGIIVLTMAGLVWAMATVLSHGGWNPVKAVILVGFVPSMMFPVMSFANALIGFVILRLARDPAGYVNPALRLAGNADPVAYRTALAVPIRHENVPRVFARIEGMLESLAATGCGDRFDVHVLSDSSRPDVVAAEEAAVADLRARWPRPDAIHYRRRTDNTGYKAGNIREFGERVRDDYELMVTLDADSYMSGAALLRLVRVMQANPRLGILQTLTMGRPSRNSFARIFQFGMRHGMRTHTVGMTWWQGDCGPYWGHNAAIRIGPFVDHCQLPILRGTGPLGGQVLSHDQVEAAQMRGAGWEVRVIADEFDSWEENPTSLPEFMRRDLRWCQGNMQYWSIVGMDGLRPMGRWQLIQAIIMYFGSPLWVIMTALFLSLSLLPSQPEPGPYPAAVGIGLFAVSTLILLGPRILGVIDTLLNAEARARYGGGPRLVVGWFTDAVFSYMSGPVMIVAQCIFMLGLLAGRSISWDAQAREAHTVPWLEAARGLWPQMAFGTAFLAALALIAPTAIPWAAPTLASLLLGVPFTVWTSTAWLGEVVTRMGLCALPEEHVPHPDLVRLERLLAARG
jgi:membrane glycosyltransferase